MKAPPENIAGLARILIEMIGTAFARTREPGLDAFVHGLEALSRRGMSPSAQGPTAALPVCRHFAEAIESATGEAAELATHLRALEPFLSWTQNPNYRRAPPAPGFLENYGYAVIAGPEMGAPALVSDPDLAMGVLLLGPRTEYPAHHHPAAELYIPLGPADWARRNAIGESAEWVDRAAGSVIHHPPNLVHATRTHDIPLAALYLWAGDLATHARLAN
jgi:hypothetical protein